MKKEAVEMEMEEADIRLSPAEGSVKDDFVAPVSASHPLLVSGKRKRKPKDLIDEVSPIFVRRRKKSSLSKSKDGKMMQHKRSPVSVNQSSFMNLMPKRLKIDAPLSSKVSSWQIPSELTELRKKHDADALKAQSVSVTNTNIVTEKGSDLVSLSTPAANTGGRDAIAVRSSSASASSSALDLIKKKLQDSGIPDSSSTSPAVSGSFASELNGSKPVEAAYKSLQNDNNKDKNEYGTPKNALNQISLWDGIIPSREQAKFWIHTSNKYHFVDQGSNLRVVRVGLLLAPGGEFAFVAFGEAFAFVAFGETDYKLLCCVILISM